MTKTKTRELTFIAVMTALIIFMTLTGLAYVPINPVFKITLLTIPVAIGGVVCGEKAGLFLGTIFGLTSLLTAILGIDALGLILFYDVSAVETIITCVVPRMICGFLPALIFNHIKNKNIGIPLSCILTSVLNTVLFLSAMWLFFADDFIENSKIVELLGGKISGIVAIFATFAGINAIIEAVAALIIGTAACKVINKLWKRA